MKNIYIICGEYGSGKTEFCVNFAYWLKEHYSKKVSIADYDVINPYFRSREKAEILKAHGIEILGNCTDNQTNTDLPALSANIQGPILRGELLVVDLAGSKNGLKPLALSMDSFNGNYELLCVLNAFRPGTATAGEMLGTILSLEAQSGLKMTGVVHNSHLVRETQAEHVLYGQEITKVAAENAGLEIKYTQLRRDIYEEIKDEIIGLPIIFDRLSMREDWQ